jgi:anti-sigma regulatory factor (Ser/Thr protein kinase)
MTWLVHDPDPGPAAGPEWSVMVFPPAPESVRAARRYIQERCQDGHFPASTCAEAELLIGELVSNVVRHVGTEARVRVRSSVRGLSVEVRDTGDPAAAVGPVEPSVRGGRGLRVVEVVATSWGVRRCAGGKVVWFDLSRPGTAGRLPGVSSA